MAHFGNCANDKGSCNIQCHNGSIISVTHNTRAHWHKNCEITGQTRSSICLLLQCTVEQHFEDRKL